MDDDDAGMEFTPRRDQAGLGLIIHPNPNPNPGRGKGDGGVHTPRANPSILPDGPPAALAPILPRAVPPSPAPLPAQHTSLTVRDTRDTCRVHRTGVPVPSAPGPRTTPPVRAACT